MLTGATGFIGSHIAERLLKDNLTTHLFVRRQTPLTRIFEEKGANLHVSPCLDDTILEKAIRDAEVIIHCAGATRAIHEKDFYTTNVEFTEKLLKLTCRPQQFIFISSQAAAGASTPITALKETDAPCPVSHYGKSKLAAENRVKDWGNANNNHYIILRPGVVFGPREKDLFISFKWINRGLFFVPGNGLKKISIIYIKDLVNAVMMSAVKDTSQGKTFFVCNDQGCSWQELGHIIQKTLNKTSCLRINIPENLMYCSAFFLDILSRATRKPFLVNRQKIIEAKQPAWLCSNQKIKKTVSWKPEIPIETGIQSTADWYIKNKWL